MCKIARGPGLQLPNDRILKASPQYNKVRVPPSPTSRTRVMIGERRDRGAGPPAEEDVVLRDIHRCHGKRRSSSRPGSRGAFGRRGRPERVRGVPQIDRGKGRRLGRVPNARRLPATIDRSPLERTVVPEALDARGRSFAKRMHSGASGGRSPSRPVSRAAPVRPLGARRSVVGRAVPPGSVRHRPRGPHPVMPRIRRISGFS